VADAYDAVLALLYVEGRIRRGLIHRKLFAISKHAEGVAVSFELLGKRKEPWSTEVRDAVNKLLSEGIVVQDNDEIVLVDAEKGLEAWRKLTEEEKQVFLTVCAKLTPQVFQ
jgi:hypothetical protein